MQGVRSPVAGNFHGIAVDRLKGQGPAVFGLHAVQRTVTLPILIPVGFAVIGFTRRKGQKTARSKSRRQKFSEFHIRYPFEFHTKPQFR